VAARLLLIEDDASIARFVALALEELAVRDPAAPAVELSVVHNLAAAREALSAGRWQLVISDLMLPDGSAESLLAEGRAVAPGAPPWLVLSAGLQPERRRALEAAGVARTLRKPVGLAELLDAVAALLRGERAVPPAAPSAETAAAADPVRKHFGGDRLLYERFRATCLERFADDLAQGDAALAAGDMAALRRVAHGLKAVLELIGEPALSALARVLEDAAAAWMPGQPLPEGWPPLARGLAGLRGRQ
jgi:DNA-binding response OmpR family regulator